MSSASTSDKNQFQLSNNRYVTVSQFRNKTRIDIREYYVADNGERKPGKKGISLSMPEWEKLKAMMDDIEKAIKDYNSGSDSD